MFHPALSVRLLVRCLLLVPIGMEGEDLYVSPNGAPSGPGTITQPYDLATALSGKVGQPGDTFWLNSGDYVIGHINTRIQGAPGLPITFRQLPGAWARLDGSLTFYESTGNVILRDLELYSSDTNRASAETNVGFNPTDINIIPGISSYSPNMCFINLFVHDQTRHGFYVSQESSNNLIYGCVICNNGWRSPDNAEGHGIYVQGSNGGRWVSNNIVFNNSGVGLHIYDNTANLYLAGITLDGNVAFNAGAIQNVRFYRDWIVGVDAPAISADRIEFDNNLGYFLPTAGQEDQVQIGRQGVNGSVTILSNYLPQGLEMNNWTVATVAGNAFSATAGNPMVTLNQTFTHLAAGWNNNTYVAPATDTEFLYNFIPLGFQSWQNATRYDSHSLWSIGSPSGAKVFIQPNLYETGRANIIVYNWENLSNVAVDLSSVLAAGAAYEVRNAEDFSAAPVLTGVFDGNPVILPMTGLAAAVPNGPMLAPAPTGPTFNVFVLLPRQIRLEATLADGQVQISWPTNSGNWVLQFAPSLSPGATWTDVPTNLAVLGYQTSWAVPVSGNCAFYRLRGVP